MRKQILLILMIVDLLGGSPILAYATTFTITVIDLPGAVATAPGALNDVGQIVGQFNDGTRPRGFLRAPDGTFTTIDPPGALGTSLSTINDVGQIVGSFNDGTGTHGFLRAPDGTITTIDVPGAAATSAIAINNTGQIVGQFNDGTSGHSFLRAPDGTITTIDPPGAVNTIPIAINDTEQIVGQFFDGSHRAHGFLRVPDGTFTTIDPPGALATSATTINNTGQIVGHFYFDVSRDTPIHGFLATISQFIPVAIDIRPGSSDNPINSKSKGNIPVAILSSTTFNALREVDIASLSFGRTGNERSLAYCNTSGECDLTDKMPWSAR